MREKKAIVHKQVLGSRGINASNCLNPMLPAEISVQHITVSKMPTRTSRGRYNWARPAALRRGRPLVDAGFARDGDEDMKVGIRGDVVKAVRSRDISAHCETQGIDNKLTIYSRLCWWRQRWLW